MKIGTKATVITPNNTLYLNKQGTIIYSGNGAVTINVLPANHEDTNDHTKGIIFNHVTSGFIIPIYVKKVFSNGTSAAAGTLILIHD